jgi:hypothetical protein
MPNNQAINGTSNRRHYTYNMNDLKLHVPPYDIGAAIEHPKPSETQAGSWSFGLSPLIDSPDDLKKIVRQLADEITCLKASAAQNKFLLEKNNMLLYNNNALLAEIISKLK